jgi:murein DD-endopeptidase MepM/ murein hydrolase activator NlpD
MRDKISGFPKASFVAVLLLLLGLLAFGPALADVQVEEAPVQDEQDDDVTLTRTEDGQKVIISGTVADGDTAAKLLGGDVHGIMQAARKHHSLANIRSGQPYTVVRDRETKALERFEYEIDTHRKLVVELDGSAWTSRVETIAYTVQLALLQGPVESSLFQAVAFIGESPALAMVVAEVFRWDIDFIRDVQAGDSFSILVEKRYRDGQFKHYGRVLGATFTNKGVLFEAFLFSSASGHAGHYNRKGESLRKTLLKAPLAFTRITSGYSKARKHPIFHDVRPHEGVDYAAPTGTPVKAVGDGVINLKGWRGGYGNTIAIRHNAGLESQYAHLSGYARGMAVGSRVRQGQVIGFVGSTGWSTGPHLDFRLKQNGRFINPTKAVNPREDSIAPGRMQEFEERKTQIRNFFAGVTSLDAYTPTAFP